MAIKPQKVPEGGVYAIPLFVSEKPALTRFTKKVFAQRNARFSFMRVVSDERGSGLIIEIFKHVGKLDSAIEHVICSGRLFRPIAVSSLAIYKKRWPHVGLCDGYDKDKHSGYSKVELVLSPFDDPVLWRGGKKTPLPLGKVAKYEPWTIWGAPQVEKRIIAALG